MGSKLKGSQKSTDTSPIDPIKVPGVIEEESMKLVKSIPLVKIESKEMLTERETQTIDKFMGT